MQYQDDESSSSSDDSDTLPMALRHAIVDHAPASPATSSLHQAAAQPQASSPVIDSPGEIKYMDSPTTSSETSAMQVSGESSDKSGYTLGESSDKSGYTLARPGSAKPPNSLRPPRALGRRRASFSVARIETMLKNEHRDDQAEIHTLQTILSPLVRPSAVQPMSKDRSSLPPAPIEDPPRRRSTRSSSLLINPIPRSELSNPLHYVSNSSRLNPENSMMPWTAIDQNTQRKTQWPRPGSPSLSPTLSPTGSTSSPTILGRKRRLSNDSHSPGEFGGIHLPVASAASSSAAATVLHKRQRTHPSSPQTLARPGSPFYLAHRNRSGSVSSIASDGTEASAASVMSGMLTTSANGGGSEIKVLGKPFGQLLNLSGAQSEMGKMNLSSGGSGVEKSRGNDS
ncbi:MAG: hypothetical protein SGCHY_004343 [Lobulomycetales sp.]